MALIREESIQGFQGLPVLRQLGLMIGLAASIALGVAIVLWSQTPNYTVLYANLSHKDTGRVLESLTKANIRHKLDNNSGSILVAAGEVYKARMHLANENLPAGGSKGFEILNKPGSPLETDSVRRQRNLRALEVELGRTIASMQSIDTARVHLTVPPSNQFVLRKTNQAKAAVFLTIYGGNSLKQGQVNAIVHLVASAVSGLDSSLVSVSDQAGNLLTRVNSNKEQALAEWQRTFKTAEEQRLITNIEDIITPIVGQGRVRAKVTGKFNWVNIAKERISYNPDNPAVSEEETVVKNNSSGTTPGGKPGASSNKPKDGSAKKDDDSKNKQSAAGSSSKIMRKKWLPDKTVTRSVKRDDAIERLSIAVLIDDKHSVNKKGEVVKTPLTKTEIEKITELVKGSVGFDALRGDVLKINNVTFYTPPAPKPLPAVSLMEQPWLWDVVKQGVGAVAVLILMFAVLKPVLKSLAEKGEQFQALQLKAQASEGGEPGQLSADGVAQLPSPEQQYEDQLNAARTMVGQDPGRVAQVVKNWVSSDG